MLYRTLLLLFLPLCWAGSASAQCSASFLPSSFGDSLVFTNNSTAANARYYWSFGDGDGSNEAAPFHIYPDDGNYQVTLYVQDTLSGCVDHFTATVQVARPDTFACNLDGEVLITQVGTTTFYSTSNNTTGCPQFTNFDCDAGNQIDQAWSIIHDPNLGKSYWLSRIQALDTANGNYTVIKEFYMTQPLAGFDPAESYDTCSANFEVVIDYQPMLGGAEVYFRAMNQSATSYNWTLYGFPTPVTLTGANQSQFYNFEPFERAWPWSVRLIAEDAANGCTDTLTRQFFIRNLNFSPFVEREETQPDFEVTVYPNPATDRAWVTWEQGNFAMTQIRIFHLNGQMLEEWQLAAGEDKLPLEVGSYPPGWYLIEVQQGDERQVKKLLRL